MLCIVFVMEWRVYAVHNGSGRRGLATVNSRSRISTPATAAMPTQGSQQQYEGTN